MTTPPYSSEQSALEPMPLSELAEAAGNLALQLALDQHSRLQFVDAISDHEDNLDEAQTAAAIAGLNLLSALMPHPEPLHIVETEVATIAPLEAVQPAIAVVERRESAHIAIEQPESTNQSTEDFGRKQVKFITAIFGELESSLTKNDILPIVRAAADLSITRGMRKLSDARLDQVAQYLEGIKYIDIARKHDTTPAAIQIFLSTLKLRIIRHESYSIEVAREVLATHLNSHNEAESLDLATTPKVEPTSASQPETEQLDAEIAPTLAQNEVTQGSTESNQANLSGGARNYLESIFGDLNDITLYKEHATTIIKTILELKPKAYERKGSRAVYADILGSYFAGTSPAGIALLRETTPSSIKRELSNIQKRIRSQPTYSPEIARKLLINNIVAEHLVNGAPGKIVTSAAEHREQVHAERQPHGYRPRNTEVSPKVRDQILVSVFRTMQFTSKEQKHALKEITAATPAEAKGITRTKDMVAHDIASYVQRNFPGKYFTRLGLDGAQEKLLDELFAIKTLREGSSIKPGLVKQLSELYEREDLLVMFGGVNGIRLNAFIALERIATTPINPRTR